MPQELGLATFLSIASGYDWSGTAYAVFIVFCRLAGFMTIIPAFGDIRITAKLRMLFAVSCAFALYALIIPSGTLTPPTKPSDFIAQIGSEIAVGIIMGSFIRVLYEALSITGTITAQMVGLSNVFDNSSQQGASSISSFLTLAGTVLLFATGVQYTFLKIIMHSYDVFPLFKIPEFGQSSQLMIESVEKSFSLGIQFSLPFLVAGWTLNVGMGFVNKIMPQMPVFFIGQALIIFVGIVLMGLIVPIILMAWLSGFHSTLVSQFL